MGACFSIPWLRARASRAERAGRHLLVFELRLGGRVCTVALYVPGLLLAPLTVHALLVCVCWCCVARWRDGSQLCSCVVVHGVDVSAACLGTSEPLLGSGL